MDIKGKMFIKLSDKIKKIIDNYEPLLSTYVFFTGFILNFFLSFNAFRGFFTNIFTEASVILSFILIIIISLVLNFFLLFFSCTFANAYQNIILKNIAVSSFLLFFHSFCILIPEKNNINITSQTSYIFIIIICFIIPNIFAIIEFYEDKNKLNEINNQENK